MGTSGNKEYEQYSDYGDIFISALVEKHKVLCSNICSKLCVNHKSINLIFTKNPPRIQQHL